MTIKTDRLILLALTRAQLAAVHNNPREALLSMGFLAAPPAREDMPARKRVYEIKGKLIERFPEYWLYCTVWLMLLDKTVVGELGFKGPPADGELEIGYGTESRYRNRGYMKEAVRALCRFCLSDSSVFSVAAFTDPENYASQSVLTACGFDLVEKDGKQLKFRLRT
jgi:RimJ/RimL family protein N-acetyltransferase